MTILSILAVSLLSCAAQLCQKQAAQSTASGARRALLFWMGLSLLLLAMAMLIWLAVLQRVPVGQAYPMLSLNFVIVALSARIIWQEKLSGRQILGTLIIMSGVALMGSHL